MSQHVATRLGLGVSAARGLVRKLVQLQWLQRVGAVNRPEYRPGAFRQVVRRYTLAGLQEDGPWANDFAPCFDM
ncbi:MAG: hypothetical protein CFE45_38615, partial [Burkholderiales bacterium PBB5]